MKNNFLVLLIVLLFSLVSESFYIVDQRQQALVFQFGEVVRTAKEPGLYFRVPFIQRVEYFEKRILSSVLDDKEIIDNEKKRLIISAYIKYKIINPLKFYQTVRDIPNLGTKLQSITESSMRDVSGKITLSDFLSIKRSEIMRQIKDDVSQRIERFGIEIVDLRILRADLPKENSAAVYKRMQTDREKEAKEIRAEGDAEATAIRATADKTSKIIIAEAYKKAQILKGEGDGEASRIYADSFSKDSEFYEFYKSLEVYKQSFNKNNSKMLISSDSNFMNYFNDK